MITVRPIIGPAELDAVRALCWHYRAFVLECDPVARPAYLHSYPVDGYTDLMNRLASVHARPGGIILAAFHNTQMVGCGMSHTFAPGVAEIKRVYVAPSVRGSGVGRAVMTALIAQIRADGFHTIVLDTSKTLTTARVMYTRLGFAETGPYYDVPPVAEGLLCWFEKRLTQSA